MATAGTCYILYDALRHSALAFIQHVRKPMCCNGAELRAVSPCPSFYHCLCRNHNHNLAWGPCAPPAAPLSQGSDSDSAHGVVCCIAETLQAHRSKKLLCLLREVWYFVIAYNFVRHESAACGSCKHATAAQINKEIVSLPCFSSQYVATRVFVRPVHGCSASACRAS